MDIWQAIILGFGAGVALTWLVLRQGYAARTIAAATERDLLRERVVDLEASLAEDLETAALLAPLRDALARVEQQVGVLERDRSQQFGAVRTMLGRVESRAEELGRQTQSLAGSLRSSSTRGAWGEVQLRRVLEASGMLARCDFDEQVAAVSRHGRTVRPDVVVRLPGERVLVIDAKSPMTAFLEAQNDDLSVAERTTLLRRHGEALRRHVDELAAKEYWSAFADTPDMVVCFVPTDAMLAAALEKHPGLTERAMSAGIVVVGPGALFALLRTVAYGWQQESLSSSARELLDLGQELYRRLGALGAHAAKLGKSLQTSVESYNQFVGALESRALVTARRMHDLELVASELPRPSPVAASPQVLTAYELLAAGADEDARSDLIVDPPTSHDGRRRTA